MQNRRKGVGVIMLVLLGCLLGFSALYTPKVKNGTYTGFSAERAAKDIAVVATEPHTVNDPEALKEVRDYLIKRLKELGVEPEVFTYENHTDKYGFNYDVNNIYGKIDGKNGENGTYIMLVAHYDSSPAKRLGETGGSRGAADDGYGLATILEVIKMIQESDRPLENGIKILFTDAEETGLVGANKEMELNKELYKNVSFVVNLEARGIKGPAIMFETSDQNLEVIKLFKEANLPVSYSLAADVYRKMPNFSDFTTFLNAGLKGINMAVLDNLDYYHTPEDNYDNISLTSLQHYGEQVLPIVETFVFNEKYSEAGVFEANENAIYFTLLPNVMFIYSNTVGIILTVGAAMLLLFTLVRSIKRGEVKVKAVGAWTLGWLGIILGAAGIGFGVSKLVSLVCEIPFKLTYMPKVPFANGIVLGTVVVGAMLIGCLVIGCVKKGAQIGAILMGGQILQMLLLIVFMIILPGGSFLFLWPLVLTCIAVLAAGRGFKWAVLIPTLLTVMMFVPILYVLNIALTIGALAVVMLLAGIAMATVVPGMTFYLKDKK